jgi:glucokinase
MDSTELVLGIDIGGTNTVFGYIDRSGQCRGETMMPTRSEQPPVTFFRRLSESARALWAGLPGRHRLVGIGLGAPNGNAFRGTIEDPPNLSWTRVDVRKELAAYWDLEVAVANDANAAALGEGMFGAGRGMRDFIVITLGTGLGTGIVVNGELVHGHSGFAGEIGHTIVVQGGRPCGCGLLGCLETYVSATGLITTVREQLAITSALSPLRNLAPAELTARAVHEAALGGDPLSLEAFNFTGTILGRKLADAVAHTSPEAIILFGGLARAGGLLFEPARKAMEANLFSVFRGTVRLLPSGVPHGQAAIMGAAALIWNLHPTTDWSPPCESV